ncbi:MAG: hypothetical protein Q4C56_06955 [Peptococcaceae bacterium]|nr:hypothetical protein [Peptococcaceae bacterium]
MKKLGIMVLVLLLLFPNAILANENDTTNYIKLAITEKGLHAYDYQVSDGSYALFGNDESRDTFSKENMKLDCSLGVQAQVVDFLLQNDETEQITNVVYGYIQTYLSSLFSGVYQIEPRSQFYSEAIYQEANARNLYEMFNKRDAGVGVRNYNFAVHIDQLKIRRDLAKVIVSLEADTLYPNEEVANVSYGIREGYLLKKVDDQWTIENIIFQTNFPNDTFIDFRNAVRADNWESRFSFENCQRKNYESNINFSDYLLGSIDKPSFNIEEMHLGF